MHHLLIEKHIMKPLEDKTSPHHKLFTPADISCLFSNIAMIEVMCSDLLKLFEQAASEAPRPADTAVGKAIIAKKIALTASFSAYCANQSKALTLYESLKKKSAFNVYLQAVRDHPQLRGLGLLDWLIKPVQRVTKYPLLLKELEKSTPSNHNDRENTVLAAKAVQELVDQVNFAAKTNEALQIALRISDEVSDIPSSLQLGKSTGRYFVTEGKWMKVSHGKHQERYFWLFSDLIMYARINVISTGKRYSYKGVIILSKSNYDDLQEGNEFGPNAIRITRLDSKKTYIIYCKEQKQKSFWLTNIKELKDLAARGGIQVQMPTIGVASIVSDSASSPNGAISPIPIDFVIKPAAESEKANNSLLMWNVSVRIAGWLNDDTSRSFIHEGPVKGRPFDKDCDYSFMFSDGWMGTKIRMFKTAQSSKNAVDFKVMIPFELMTSFEAQGDLCIEIGYADQNGSAGSVTLEYDTTEQRNEWMKVVPTSEIGRLYSPSENRRASRITTAQSSNDPQQPSTSSPTFQSPSVSPSPQHPNATTNDTVGPTASGPNGRPIKPPPAPGSGSYTTLRGNVQLSSSQPNLLRSALVSPPRSRPLPSTTDALAPNLITKQSNSNNAITDNNGQKMTPFPSGGASKAPPKGPTSRPIPIPSSSTSVGPSSSNSYGYRKTSPRPNTPTLERSNSSNFTTRNVLTNYNQISNTNGSDTSITPKSNLSPPPSHPKSSPTMTPKDPKTATPTTPPIPTPINRPVPPTTSNTPAVSTSAPSTSNFTKAMSNSPSSSGNYGSPTAANGKMSPKVSSSKIGLSLSASTPQSSGSFSVSNANGTNSPSSSPVSPTSTSTAKSPFPIKITTNVPKSPISSPPAAGQSPVKTTNIYTPPPSNTKQPPPSNTKQPPPSNTKQPPPSNTKQAPQSSGPPPMPKLSSPPPKSAPKSTPLPGKLGARQP